MSSTKDYLLEVQAERADEWVRERLSDETLDENSEEYIALTQEYYDEQEYLADEAQWQAELEWLKENGSSEIHRSFISSLDLLTEMIEKNQPVESFWHTNREYQMRLKMLYSYAVTLLETFLADTLKSLITENDIYLKNAVVKLDILKTSKLSELAKTDLNIRAFVFKKLAKVSFHNISNVVEMYRRILGKSLELKYSEVEKITYIRHDIVHRDGRTPDGKKVNLEDVDFDQVIDDIKEFAGELQKVINQSSVTP